MTYLCLGLAVIACLRGWFPWALLVFTLPFALPYLATQLAEHGASLPTIRSFAAFDVRVGTLAVVALLLMVAVSRD